jgi:hypothetical protein
MPDEVCLCDAVLCLQVGRRAVDQDFNVPEAASTVYM